MSKTRRFILSAMLLCIVGFCFYCAYLIGTSSNSPVMTVDDDDMNSTLKWQELAENYLTRRNDILNSILDGGIESKEVVANLKSIECSPLLQGDIELVDYMSKNKSRFTNRISGIKVEYGDIRQLTEDEVIMTVKIGHVENNTPVHYNYELIFRNVKDKWLLSKFSFAR